MDLKHIIYEKKDKIATIRLNRPEVLNAINPPTSEELVQVFDDFKADDSVWIAIVTGTGERAFCAGADIKWMAEHRDEQPQGRTKDSFAHRFGGIVRQREIWKPIIAAVNGYCLGGGMEIALACDIIVAAEHAQFGLPEIKSVGAAPGSGGPLRLPRQIPLKIATWMLLSGKFISAQEAYRIGLVNEVVPFAQLMDKATEMANIINENPPKGVRRLKEIIYKSLDVPLEYPLTAWDLYEAISMGASMWKEREDAPQAFVEKRRPEWKSD